jgi:hypothetical protein
MCERTQQAGHMDASDLIKPLQDTLQGGGRPHMGSGFRPFSGVPSCRSEGGSWVELAESGTAGFGRATRRSRRWRRQAIRQLRDASEYSHRTFAPPKSLILLRLKSVAKFPEFRNGSHCRWLVGKRLFSAPFCAGMKRCGNPVIQEFRKMEIRLLWLHRLALDKEHPHQPAFPEDLVEDLKSEIRNEHQQDDQVAGEYFLEPGANKIAERCSNRPVVEQSNNDLLDYGQDHQQQQEGERLVQRRPDQRAGVTVADLHGLANHDELGQYQGLDDADDRSAGSRDPSRQAATLQHPR